jgi:hypothetical protein
MIERGRERPKAAKVFTVVMGGVVLNEMGVDEGSTDRRLVPKEWFTIGQDVERPGRGV